MINTRTALAALAVVAASAPAHAAVTISTAATQNVSCSGGTCAPTAAKAVLNASDLQTYLSQFGNVRVITTGSGVEANNIEVRAAFSSPDSTSLTLEAHKAITVNAAVSIGSGAAELELQSDTLAAPNIVSFGKKGHVTFGGTSDIFGINGGIFTLVGSVQGLANAVAANPSGAFALANSYDASGDGTYGASPIATTFAGSLEGLGNTISNLTIASASQVTNVGLFTEVGSSGSIASLRLTNAQVSAMANSHLGVLAALSYGVIFDCSAQGTINASAAEVGSAGGLVGATAGVIRDSSANVALTVQSPRGKSGADAGGLVGGNGGTIEESYASGSVISTGTVHADVGGLAGLNAGLIENSYAEGAAVMPRQFAAGGLVGLNYQTIERSYSSGAPSGGGGGPVGGLIGGDKHAVDNEFIKGTYWDTTTSGITDQSQGAGNVANDPGITGLTTTQFQSGLPAGFDPKIWAEDANINNGLPYLIANPPPK